MKLKVIVNLVVIFLCVQLTNAQFTKLFDFTKTVDIQHPMFAQFVTDGTWLYGTTRDGGANNDGAIFRIKPDGTGYGKLLDFSSSVNGANPYGALTIDGNILYGTTGLGGAYGDGTLYKINTDGTGYNRLVDFQSSTKGGFPNGSLALSGNILYGMTSDGGANNLGCIFKVNTDGTGYTKLLDFSGFPDGAIPYGSLSLSGNVLYGMTFSGGDNNQGSIFRINTDGTGFTKLLNFNGTGNGSNPYGSLAREGDVLYGMTNLGGAHNSGCVFKINTDGTAYKDLLDFNHIENNIPSLNGSKPTGSLIISDNKLYGMTSEGGGDNSGVVFSLRTDGTGYTKIKDLNLVWGGVHPTGSLLLLNGVLYGMNDNGGAESAGSIFRVNADGTGYTILLHCGIFGNGAVPMGMTISNNTGYMITNRGGAYSMGSISKINTDGTGYTKLFDLGGSFLDETNGAYPHGALILSGTTLYGSTAGGGANGWGCIFKINPDGTGYTNLYSFNDTIDHGGRGPIGNLVLSENMLYGITGAGGNHGSGIIFKINTDGSGFTKLFDFNFDEGAGAEGGLLLSGVILYGVTPYGGTGNGNIFKINKDGTGFVNLHSFDGTADGASNPRGTPVMINNVLYGTASAGGASNNGSLYKINMDGTGFANIKSFTLMDGIHPFGSLTAVGNTFFGMTNDGGANAVGTIFSYNTANNEFTKIWDFTANDGAHAYGAPLLFSSGKLYGETFFGGTGNKGVVFSLAITPSPKIDPVITWNNPADITYGTLLDTTQLNAKANVPGTFVYTPAAGTKLEAGNARNLKADFTPADTISYNKASKTVTINVSPVTGTGSLNNNDIRMYPNPFGEYIVIESSKSYAYISVFDLNGKLITGITTKGQFKNTISLKNQEAGTYVVVIKDNDNKTLMVKRIEKIK